MNIRAIGSLLGVVASVSLASVVLAQSTAGDGSLTEIVVTARRTEERLQDVPIAISVLDRQQLTDRNIVAPADLATYTPSLSINQRFGPDDYKDTAHFNSGINPSTGAPMRLRQHPDRSAAPVGRSSALQFRTRAVRVMTAALLARSPQQTDHRG
jgi:hypothetical protein